MTLKSTFLLILSSIAFISCGSVATPKGDVIYVSIAPLKYIVEQIADSNVRVEVLVPETTSPESYEPTIQQIKELSRAKAYISIGLIDFEQALSGKIEDIAPQTAYLNLSDGVKTVMGSCGHAHGSDHNDHGHGSDPHIWLSPKIIRQMSMKVAELLSSIYPQSSELHEQKLAQLIRSIDSLDRYIHNSLDSTSGRSFAIGHPSLSYFAEDYNLNQISIEVDGKEPSVRALKQLIDTLRVNKISVILYQRQTSDAAAQTIARETGGRAIEFDPLSDDLLENLRRLTDTLHSSLKY